MASSKVILIGDKELEKYIKEFPIKSEIAIKKVIKEKTTNTKRAYVTNIQQNKQTGDLEASVYKKIKRKGQTGEVGSDSFVSRLIEYGSKPHKIKIKNKKVLSDGVDFFGKEVKHPGYKGNPGLTRAFFKHIGLRGQWLIEALKREFSKIK